MNEDPFKNKQEKLDIKIKVAGPEDWEACKALRLKSITGPRAYMLGATPEVLDLELNKSDEEWKKETQSEEMFSVLAWADSRAVGLGRAKKTEEGFWRMRNGYVEPEFERKGIQTKMIALRLKEMIERGGVKAITGIRLSNSVSLHNAEKLGFRIVRVEDDWNIMYCDLTDPAVIEKINQVLNAR